MKRILYSIALFGIFSGVPAAAVAQDSSPPANEDVSGAKTGTRIEVDEKANVIRFVIDGVERAVLDHDGLHIIGDIHYSGAIADTGRDDARSTGETP